jgi:hypothetical protein
MSLRATLSWIIQYVAVSVTLAAFGAWQVGYRLPTGWPVFGVAIAWVILGVVLLLSGGKNVR